MECPTCHRQEPCPTCGGAGDFLRAAPKTERFHFFRRLVWVAHRIRQGYARKSTVLADDMSDIIDRAEANEVASRDVDDEETELH